MKKILIFSLAYYPHVGGAEVAIKEITDRINPSDIEFHLITKRFTKAAFPEETIGNVHVYRVGGGTSYLSKVLYIPRATWKAMALHREKKFDVLWAMMSYMMFPIMLMRLWGVKLPYAITLQEGDPFEHVFERLHVKLVLPLLRAGFRNANVITAISTFLSEWARTMGYTGPLEIIPNGVDTRRFLGEMIAHEGTMLITTSRLVHKNGIDTVIKALTQLPDTVKFLILGTGPLEEVLKLQTKDYGLQTRVEFLGHVDHKEMIHHLKIADIFIRASRSEGMGNSFIEAMAAGLPVIATQEGGIADFLFDEKRNPDKPTTGWAVDKDSPEQIAQVVKEILANPEKVKRVTETARMMVLEKYDWDLIAKQMREKVFTRVL